MPIESTAPSSRETGLMAAACFLLALVLVFSISIWRKVDVDEHPFIATAALLNRGFLPYRDYHYNHMPTEVMIYAGLFRMTDHLLLAARLFQAICAAGMVALIAAFAQRSFAHLNSRARILLSGGFALALACHPIFTRTAGRSWNHDFPTFACLAGFLAMAHGVRGRWAIAWALVAGALAGLAATSRLTFAPVTLAYALLPMLYPGLALRKRLILVLAMGVGLLIASLPAVWVWAQSPQNAYFGNFLYPKLNTEFHGKWDRDRRFTLVPIVMYYLQLWFTLPGNGVLMVAFLLLMGATVRPAKIARDPRQSVLFAVAIAVICLTGAGFMPAPPFAQYFYAAVPFTLLGVILCLAAREGLALKKWLPALAGGLAITVGFSVSQYLGVGRLFSVRNWIPMQAHQIGSEVAQAAGPGKFLTLEMVYPLEGGRDIYEKLATSRFGLRTAQFLSEEKRQQYRMPLPADLNEFFTTDPPAAVLIVAGTDRGLEHVFIADAVAHGYVPTVLAHGETVWMPSGRASGQIAALPIAARISKPKRELAPNDGAETFQIGSQ